MSQAQLKYYNDQELQSATFDWSNAGYDFSTGWTFNVRLCRSTAPATTLLYKTTGITATATTITVAWTLTDWAGLEAAVNGTPYVLHLYARRTADSKDLVFAPGTPTTLTLYAAAGTSAVSPSSYPITVTAASVTLADTADNFVATNVEDALAESVVARKKLRARPVTVKDIKVMSSPPTIGALTAATAIVSPQYFYTHSGPSTPDGINTSFFTTSIGPSWKLLGSTFPNYNYVDPSVLATTGAGSAVIRTEFDVDCTAFEVMCKGNAGNVRIWVDGELVSATPTTMPNDGAFKFIPITFASKAVRRITLDWYNPAFGGVVIGPTDTVYPAAVNRPKVLMIGDSFIEGSGSNNVDGLVPTLGASLGWDIWAAGQGGSGYVNPGPYTGKYSTRIPFYSSIAFDAVVVSGGINDAQTTYQATLAAEAASLFATIKSTWPTAVWIATSPLYNKGAAGLTTLYLDTYNTIKTAAATAGFAFADVVEFSNTSNSVSLPSGTLSSSASLGATSLSVNFRPPIGTTVEIGSGSVTERRVVTNTSGGGPYTLTVAATTFAHSAGETVRQVGGSLLTGTGRVGATTGTGNCDLYVSTDGTHPSVAGHYAFGRALAHRIATAVNALTT